MEDGWHASQLGLQAAPLASAVAGLSTASPPPEVTMIPMATAGPCYTNCQMVMPFMVLLFFMTLVVAVTQVHVRLLDRGCVLREHHFQLRDMK